MSRTVFTGDKSYFPDVDQIKYEGPGSDNPLAFKTYDPERVVARQDHGGAFAFCRLLLAFVLRNRWRSLRPRHPRTPVDS